MIAERASGETKGLKAGALGFVSNVVIGVASTAPGYSLAASLGLVVAAVGLQSPAIMLLAFVPMLLIAASYYYMNRADADAGTTFSWVTLAMGPWLGWLGGWAIVVADIIVMANLAQIAGIYTFLLVGADSYAASTFWVTLVGVLWIVDHDGDLLHRRRAVARRPSGTCWRRRSSRWRCSPSSRCGRCTSDSPPGVGRPVAVVAQPVRRSLSTNALVGRDAAGGLHLLGLGQHRHASTRSPTTRTTGRGWRRSSPRWCWSAST